MVPMNVWIDRYVRRVRFGEFLRRAAEAGAAYLLLFGGAVLLVKLAIPRAWPHILWLALGALPVAGLAYWLSHRRRMSRWESVARLDASLNTGGLLMTLSERPDEDWSERLPQFEQMWREALPRFRPKRFASYLAMPLIFAVGACFVPLRQASTATTLRNTVGQQETQELEELLESIEKASAIEEEEKKQLQEEIEKLAEETKETPLTHEKWETVDALRERMKVRLESAALTASKASEAASLLARAGDTDAPELTLERTEQLEKELLEALQKLQQKGAFSGASKDLRQQLQRLMKNGKFQMPKDPGEVQELLDELREHLEKESKKLSELRKKCSSCKSGKCEGECESECEGGLCQGDKSGNRPGRGGITRGRGDADLTYGDESDKQGVKFKETVLPKGFLDQPKDEVVGIQRTAPNEEAAATAARSAQRLLDPAAGEATWNRKLNPRHRNAVRKYFDSKAEAKTE